MQKRKESKRHRIGEIPVGSFSDIAFLLIIYFMVATTLVKVKAIRADMPSSEMSSESSKEDDTPTIMVVGTDIKYDDTPVSLEVLNERLAALGLKEKQDDKKVVLFGCTRDTPYDACFKVLSAITANGGIIVMMEEGES